MKQVNALEILGNPTRVDQQVACPGCSARAMLFSDGSIVCVAEGGKCYAPTATDGEYFRMRQQFDADNGIQPADRVILPTALREGFTANMPNRYDR
jgi:hypothetical protein